jgi:cysteinyl-tRNA synthetase
MGNARFYVVFDAIRRYLRWRGFDVNFVQNFTDIDDKIITKANEENCTTEEIAARYISHTIEDLAALNCLPATTSPRATQEIPEIITLISALVEKKYAYENNGTVYYDVNKFEGYGKLSRKKVEDLEAGARVEVEAGKRNPMDFVLWKPAKPDEPKWSSPWGEGRPGWHIECSAMAKKYLGDQIDIHGGAEDLIFPHHENEIAQTEAVTGLDFARFWMHCGILTTEHKKMSKSRGNFFTFREMAEKFPPHIIRFYFLSGHYRMPMEFTDEVLKAAGQGLQRIENCYENLCHAASKETPQDINIAPNTASEHTKNFHAAMEDDFNTADAITAIFELVKMINISLGECNLAHNKSPKACLKEHENGFFTGLKGEMESLCDILGIQLPVFLCSVDVFMTSSGNAEMDAENVIIDALIADRQEARKNKNFAEADRIRDELSSMGIIIEDTSEGVRWKRK